MKKPFKINNRIDLGTDGSFSPGSEPRLKAALADKKDGDKIFTSLVNRGAIQVLEVKEPKKNVENVTKPGKKSTKKKEAETEDKDEAESTAKEQEQKDESGPEKGDKVVDENTDTTDDETADDSEAELETTDEGQPDYKPTGKWEKNGYGGGMFEIINPKGFVVDTVRGEDNANARIEKENK